MRIVLRGIVLLSVLLCSVAYATEAQDKKARELYAEGQAQYSQEHYQAAYDLFKQAYLLSPSPALRYNMASALQGLGRPHEAAEEFRAFLRLKPEDPDKAKIEERIRGLEEAQRLLDADRKPAPAPAATLLATPAASPPVHEGGTHRKTVIIVLSTVGAVLVAGGLGVGLGLGLHDWHTGSTLGTQRATP